MFYNCKSLSTLSDISKWNTNKVRNMSYMFSDCDSLSSLPDILKWNINNVNNMNFMFSDYKLASSLDNISIWFNKNIIQNKISIIYNNISNKRKFRIFGEQFVKNNKDKCILIINDKEMN